jgi:hypothetical protein
MCVCFIGDGNFSFSLAYVKRLEDCNLKADSVFCTSFDPDEDLFEKYPESESVLSLLQKYSFVRIMHNVDATQLGSAFPDETFDEIIFHFPHLGYENLQLHKALVAHIMHR